MAVNEKNSDKNEDGRWGMGVRGKNFEVQILIFKKTNFNSIRVKLRLCFCNQAALTFLNSKNSVTYLSPLFFYVFVFLSNFPYPSMDVLFFLASCPRTFAGVSVFNGR